VRRQFPYTKRATPRYVAASATVWSWAQSRILVQRSPVSPFL